MRGYPKQLVTSIFEKARESSQSDLVFSTKIIDPKVTPFIIPYSDASRDISRILHEEFQVIQENNELNQIWLRPPVAAYKRNQNLKDLFVHTKFRV